MLKIFWKSCYMSNLSFLRLFEILENEPRKIWFAENLLKMLQNFEKTTWETTSVENVLEDKCENMSNLN